MSKKPFTIIAERLGEILALCREISSLMPMRVSARIGKHIMVAVVAESDSPRAERCYVWVPEGVRVGDVVSYTGRLLIDDLLSLGVVRELYWPEELEDLRTPGRALKVWAGPGVRLEERNDGA